MASANSDEDAVRQMPLCLDMELTNMTSSNGHSKEDPYNQSSKSSFSRKDSSATEAGLPAIPTTIQSVESSAKQRMQDIFFLATALMSQVTAQGSFGASLICIKDIGAWLGTQESNQFSWMLATYGLTLGLCVIITGRLGDIYGHKKAVILGYILFTILYIGVGFCKTPLQYDILRAISGVAGAFVMPNSGALISRKWRPGRKRTMAFALLGAMGPMGFFAGGLVGAAINNAYGPRWIYFFFAALTFLTGFASFWAFPRDSVSGKGKLDLIGSAIGFTGMILFNVAWNFAAEVGWRVLYVWVILLVSIFFLVGFFFYEKMKGDDAVMPIRLFTKEVVAVCLSLWWGWMSLGGFLYYTTAFLRDLRGVSNPVTLCLQMIPMAPAGVVAAMSIVVLFRLIPGHYIFGMAMVAFIVGNLLTALASVDQSYWALTFPAALICVFGPDLSFASAALIIANSAPREFQGVASSLVNLITNYSMSIGLGMAGTVEYYVRQSHDGNVLAGYKGALWFGVGLSVAGFILVVLFVRTKPPKEGEELDDVEF